MKNIFFVNDYRIPGRSDSDAIDLCFAEANRTEAPKTIVFRGDDYLLDRAILLGSDTEVIVDGCTLKQNDRVFDNLFRGDNLLLSGVDPYGTPAEVLPLKNIKITGKGNATVLGTDVPGTGYHPHYKNQQQMTGDFWGWRTHAFSFSNCDGVEISGLNIRQTMGWCICFDHCQNCHVHDIDVRSDVKNGDGVNFRSGCHHCIAENITGYTSDDTVACTALSVGNQTRPAGKYLAPSEPYNVTRERTCPEDGDVHDIKIRNIRTGGCHHGVICLAANGNKVYNVEISDVIETPDSCREATVKIYTGYGTGYTKGDIHHISIRNVVSEKAKYALMIACEPEDLTAEDIVQNNPDGETFFEQ